MHAPAALRAAGLARRIGIALAVPLACAVTAPAAFAGVGLSAVPNIPSPNGQVTVGQSGIASSLTVLNTSDDVEGSLDVVINPDTIMLEPSCGSIPLAGGPCATAAFDPGVFSLSSTGVGASGTACAGVTFTIVAVPGTAGEEYEFKEPIGTTIILGPGDIGGLPARCTINFTVSVLKVPTLDARSDSGVQTDEFASAAATAVDLQTGGGSGTNFTTVAPAPVSFTTAASPATIGLGASFQDTATLAPPAAAVLPTGSVTFDVYGPTDPMCSGPVLFTSVNPVNGSDRVTSTGFQPVAAGSYHVIASYSGDADYLPAAGRCNDIGETATVTKAALSIVTQVSPATIELGSTFADTATVMSAVGAPVPRGAITFNVYGPGDGNCSAMPAFTSTDPLNAAGTTAVSADILPVSAGTYRVIASYPGDADFAPFSTGCNDVNETETVIAPPTTPATPATPSAPTTPSMPATGPTGPTGPVTPALITTGPTGVVKDATIPRRRLELVKYASPTAVKQGGTVTFTLTVTNNGPVGDTHVLVCDVLPTGITLVTRGMGRLTDGELCWTVGRLAAGAMRSEHFRARIDEGITSGTIINHAVATATRVAPVNARASVRVIPVPLPGSSRETVTG